MQALALEHEQRGGAERHGGAQGIAPATVDVDDAVGGIILRGVKDGTQHEFIPPGEEDGALAPGEAVAGGRHSGVAGGDGAGHELFDDIRPRTGPIKGGQLAAPDDNELVEILNNLASTGDGDAWRKGHDPANLRLPREDERGGAYAHDPRIAFIAGIGKDPAPVGGGVGGDVGSIIIAQVGGAVGEICARVARPRRGRPTAAALIDALDEAQIQTVRDKPRRHEGRRAHIHAGKREIARGRREVRRIAGAERLVAGEHGRRRK